MSGPLLAPTHAFVLAWDSLQQAQFLHLSAPSTAKINLALSHAWADSTSAKYQSSLDCFLQFCKSEHIPPHLQLPASDDLLCAFAASKVGSVSAGTVQGYLAVVKAWHVLNNKPWLGSHHIRYILNGVANLAPPSSSKPPRAPATHSMLVLLAFNLNLTSSLDSCCFAAACMAFWAQLRLHEVLSPYEKSFSSSSTVCRSHLNPPFNEKGSRLDFLPFTKVAKFRGESVIICRQADTSDPIDALNIHLLINDPPNDLPLFSYHSQQGWHCLTSQKLLLRCNAIWSAASLTPFTGHSFCIGGTTELLLSNVPPDVVKALGHWSSDAFLHYWRSLELLAPFHAELLPSRS
ncbi:hypothetical protein OG21DRAFT_1490117 [Imleria badia]|nr:hypothetical protein OG21DRAFT_1490117 [Imleria badia]